MGTLPWPTFAALYVLVRLPWFFQLPMLSDDFYRFLWDGMLLVHGINPFGAVPATVDVMGIAASPFGESFAPYMDLLRNRMNSPQYGSVYPPLHQALFWLGAQWGGTNLLAGVNAMRLAVVAVEVAVAMPFIRGHREPLRRLWVAYLLCPLVVAEGVGNLHLESFMVPLLGLAMYHLVQAHTMRAALWWAAGVLTKLTPLLLLPALVWRLRLWRRPQPALLAAAVLALAFVPFAPWSVLGHAGDNFGLYFQRFEFNASVYYLLRMATEWVLGYNAIAVIGPAMAACTLGIVAWLAVARTRMGWYSLALYTYLAYFLLATTVHPWYLMPVVWLAMAARRPIWLGWAWLSWLSYALYGHGSAAYTLGVTVEYFLLFAVLFFEWYPRRPLPMVEKQV
jgi:hypothetical protein